MVKNGLHIVLHSHSRSQNCSFRSQGKRQWYFQIIYFRCEVSKCRILYQFGMYYLFSYCRNEPFCFLKWIFVSFLCLSVLWCRTPRKSNLWRCRKKKRYNVWLHHRKNLLSDWLRYKKNWLAFCLIPLVNSTEICSELCSLFLSRKAQAAGSLLHPCFGQCPWT